MTPENELPGMPEAPALLTTNGRLIENARITLRGGVSFELRTEQAVAYLDGFKIGQTVEIVARGRVADVGDRSKLDVDGQTLLRFVVIAIDDIDGAPGDAASVE